MQIKPEALIQLVGRAIRVIAAAAESAAEEAAAAVVMADLQTIGAPVPCSPNPQQNTDRLSDNS